MIITSWKVRPADTARNLVFSVNIQCPTCHGFGTLDVDRNSDIWRWGLDGTIDDRLNALLRSRSGHDTYHPAPRDYECSCCGSVSRIATQSITRVGRELRTAVGHLPEGFGAPWALAKVADFMPKHQQDRSRFGSYSYSCSSGAHHNEFLLRYCPCERCEAGRAIHPYIKTLAPKYFDLTRFPVLAPVEVVCTT